MNPGTFYGIGVGPGDPELITVKAASVLGGCRHVFVPTAEASRESTALDIARRFVRPDARVYPLSFPMTADRNLLSQHWSRAADEVLSVLREGADACFLTLGDCLLYSTYIYLLRELQSSCPGVNVITIPGVNSFSAAAALANFPLGEGKESVRIVPVAENLDSVRRALEEGGTVILMKVGRRLAEILSILEAAGLLAHAVFAARAGQPGEQIVTDMQKLTPETVEAGYLSTILVHAGKRGDA